jgi:monofunctional biosynthetic peptidoglycan transglycosylase
MRLDLATMAWQIINDGVMGGLSRSACSVDASGLHFHGFLSTANGGGFASVRAALAAPIGYIAGVRMSVTGDEGQYQLRLRETGEPDTPAWRALFRTRGGPDSIEIAARQFEPVIRGRRVELDPGLEQRKIRHIGFMLTSRREGPFALSIHDVEISILQDRDG